MNKKKKMFFLTNMFPNDDSRGITKKVFAQMRAFEKLGYEVQYYTGYKDDGAVILNRDGSVAFFKKYPTKINIVNRLLRNKILKRMSYDFFKTTEEKFDCVYLRYLFFDPISIKMFREAKKHTPYLLLEMHSYPNYNKGQYSLYPVFAIDRICRNRAIKYIDKIVAISKSKNIFGKPTYNIDNGIDLDSIKPQRKNPHKGLNIISVSYEWLAHGYDRLIKGLYEYYKDDSMDKIDVQIILVGTVMASTERLIHSLGMDSHVKCVGIKKGSELDEIYDNCDLGAGCLAVHRVNTQDSSGLKTKEYIAKGIPFFYAGEPLFAKESFPYALQLKSDETPININSIIAFNDSIKETVGMTEKMREWAKEYTWETQMKPVFEG